MLYVRLFATANRALPEKAKDRKTKPFFSEAYVNVLLMSFINDELLKPKQPVVVNLNLCFSIIAPVNLVELPHTWAALRDVVPIQYSFQRNFLMILI